MAGRKSATTRKRGPPARPTARKAKGGAPATTTRKKKETLAAKKKHVRDLAQAGRWHEIKAVYGQKMLLKSKAYAEKHRVKQTPQQIASAILRKNGYQTSPPQTVAGTATSVPDPVTRGGRPAASLRAEATSDDDSLGILTREQQERIQQRRREALERRQRTQQAVSSVQSRQAELICLDNAQSVGQRSRQLDPVASAVGSPRRQPQQHPQSGRQHSSTAAGQQNEARLGVVTPDRDAPGSRLTVRLPPRPAYFWDDLEAAAEIVQWEKDHMAEAALGQVHAAPPSVQQVVTSVDLPDSGNKQAEEKARFSPEYPKTPSISQELAAAAEMVQWEEEHKAQFEMPENSIAAQIPPAVNGSCFAMPIAISDDDELEAPQFNLLPPRPANVFKVVPQKQGSSTAAPLHNPTSAPRPNRSSNSSRMDANSQNKRSLAEAASSVPNAPVLPVKSVVASISTTTRCLSSSTTPQKPRSPTIELIDKRFLEDKLELPVLEFLDMMLA